MSTKTRVIAEPRTAPLNIANCRITLPSRFLTGRHDPMPWVPAANTDVTKTWARAQKGGVL